jgi:holo-[acyl-carrier protein] synthase
MVHSLGVDIIEIERIRQALQRWPRLAPRLFTERERAYCARRADPAPCYAARFAAKEATAKALGGPLRWHDVEIQSDPSGRPYLVLAGDAADLAQGSQLLLSLSHSRDYAVACVVLAGQQESASSEENSPPGARP